MVRPEPGAAVGVAVALIYVGTGASRPRQHFRL